MIKKTSVKIVEELLAGGGGGGGSPFPGASISPAKHGRVTISVSSVKPKKRFMGSRPPLVM